MLTKHEKRFSMLFFGIVLLELITGSIASLAIGHYIAKPAIAVSLILFFATTANGLTKPIKRWTLLALLFALLGDILLMFVERSPHYFTIGLVAFLVAHVMYTRVFLKHRNAKTSPVGFIALLLVYALGLFYLLKEGLGDMLIPVIVYMLVILTMATTAYLRRHIVNRLSYNLVFAGALCFMVSDSILALDKFYQAMPWSHLSIMLTYALAQYLIVLGILKINKG